MSLAFVLPALAALAACQGSSTGNGPGASAPSNPEPSAAELTTGATGIYDDALATGWSDWSWATRNLANTSPVASGTRSISVNYGAWQGLYLHNAGVSTANLATLDFQVNGGSTAGPAINAYLTQGGNGGPQIPVAQYCAGGTIPANAWTSCHVPLSALGASNATIDGVVLQEGAGKTLPTMYFDSIQLSPSTSSSTTTSGTSWVYRDAMVSPWGDQSTARHSLNNSSPVYAGTRSISARMGAWQALVFGNAGFSTSGHNTFSLEVNGGSGGAGAALRVRAQVNGAWTTGTPLGPTCAGGAIPANAWTRCDVPLSAIAPVGATVTAISVREDKGVNLPTLYFDEIGVDVPSSTTTPPAQTVAVAVTPSTASVQVGATAQFSATVTGSANTAVTWTVQEGSAGGSVSAAGLYTAPSTAGTYHVVATSQADATKSATATVTVSATTTPPATVAVSVSPSSASVQAGASTQFSATVTGSTNTAVTWSVQEGSAGGSVSAAGLYTAPSTAGTYHVVATSQADATKSASATVTVSATTTPPPSTSGKESWVWVYTDYANQLNSISANKASFTHISPTFYTVNYNYQSGVADYTTCPTTSGTYNCTSNGSNNFAGLTTKQFTDKVTAMGLVTVPAIYGGSGNGGTDTGILNILDNVNGAGDNFISAMTAEAVNNGYAGYNIDWEAGSVVGGAYADKFITFVNKFKAALAPHNMSLSVDAIVSNINGTYCSGNSGFLDFPKLNASSIDRVIIEDYVNTLGTATTSCQNVVLSSTKPVSCDFTLTGELNMMCSPNLSLDKAVIGLEADPGGTNPIAGPAFSTIKSYGFTRVAVWPQYPFMNNSGISPSGSNWYTLLQNFLAP